MPPLKKQMMGNKLAEKPKICPYCKKEVMIWNYVYIRKKPKNNDLKR
tara:strand:+ start:2290 stop:2430 length:141 start_codon:yes stop_codon:yes gene_type:complete